MTSIKASLNCTFFQILTHYMAEKEEGKTKVTKEKFRLHGLFQGKVKKHNAIAQF